MNIAKGQKRLKEWGLAFALALVFALLVRLFAFQSYVVPSNTMAGTLFKGERVYVNKLSYGPRMPITLLSLPFFEQYYSDMVVLTPKRIKTSNIERNDVLAYNSPEYFDPPIDKKQVSISRCVGLPGDTLMIRKKHLTVNNENVAFPEAMRLSYRIVTDGSALDETFCEEYGIVGGGLVSDIGMYDFPLNKEQLKLVEENKQVQYVREMHHFPREKVDAIFPIGKYYSWNRDYFGELVIPYKGQIVPINYRTIEVYRDIITEHEGNILRKEGTEIYLNERLVTKYKIKNDYYFVLDDNRDFADDSRQWGFLPYDHVIGKVSLLWFPYNKSLKGMDWSRLFFKANE